MNLGEKNGLRLIIDALAVFLSAIGTVILLLDDMRNPDEEDRNQMF